MTGELDEIKQRQATTTNGSSRTSSPFLRRVTNAFWNTSSFVFKNFSLSVASTLLCLLLRDFSFFLDVKFLDYEGGQGASYDDRSERHRAEKGSSIQTVYRFGRMTFIKLNFSRRIEFFRTIVFVSKEFNSTKKVRSCLFIDIPNLTGAPSCVVCSFQACFFS